MSGVAPNLNYTPGLNEHGADTFTFKVNDGTQDSAAATVAITITPVNDAPVARVQRLSTAEDTIAPINGNLLARVPEPDAKTWVRWMRPHAFAIPPDELRPGENTLHVRINPANRDRIISSIHIGPDETVRPLYESRFFLTYTLAQIISAVPNSKIE